MKLTNVKGRIDYISNPKRQEHLYCTFSTVTDPKFWDFLVKQNQEDFRASGTAGKCIEARELIISLPEELEREYNREKILEAFVLKFKLEYGTDAIAALHHNKAMTNYHIHLIFSERNPMEHTVVKRATRNMFYNEQGKHVRTKKEIMDEKGEIRKGCRIVSKGDIYDVRYFQPKETVFKSRTFTADAKQVFTEFINELVTDEREKLTVFDHKGPYLAIKKIGKNNPREAEIRADNAARREWNQTVDEALTAGIPEEKIHEVKAKEIQAPMRESIKTRGSHPELLSGILKKAVEILLSMIRNLPERRKKTPTFDAEVFHKMQAVRKQLLQQNVTIGKARNRLERARANADRLSRPENLFRRKEKKAALKKMGEALLVYQTARARPDQIVKEAGYKNVAAFTTAFERACELIREVNISAQNVKIGSPMAERRESILEKLKMHDRDARTSAKGMKLHGMSIMEER